MLKDQIECRFLEDFVLLFFEELHAHPFLVKVYSREQIFLLDIQLLLLCVFSQAFEQEISLKFLEPTDHLLDAVGAHLLILEDHLSQLLHSLFLSFDGLKLIDVRC